MGWGGGWGNIQRTSVGIKPREELISGWYPIKYERGRNPIFQRQGSPPSLVRRLPHRPLYPMKTNHKLFPYMAVPVLGITPVTPNKKFTPNY